MKHFLSIVFACLTSVAFAESPLPDEPVIETVAEGFRFTEGPAIAPDGSVWFTDIPNNAIHRFDPETAETTQITDDSGGANGLVFLGPDRLLVCEDRLRRTVATYRINLDVDPVLRIEGRGFSGMNGPNDAVFHQAVGNVYFTDPIYGKTKDLLEHEAVYLLDLNVAAFTKPKAYVSQIPIITDLVRPNGIGLSPDQRTLYVADNGAKKLYAYPLDEGGNREGDGVLLHDVNDLGGPDGMTVDDKGNVYQAIYGGGVVVISSEGERLDYVEVGPRTTNVAITADQRTLYVTSDGKLKRIALNAGAE